MARTIYAGARVGGQWVGVIPKGGWPKDKPQATPKGGSVFAKQLPYVIR